MHPRLVERVSHNYWKWYISHGKNWAKLHLLDLLGNDKDLVSQVWERVLTNMPRKKET